MVELLIPLIASTILNPTWATCCPSKGLSRYSYNEVHEPQTMVGWITVVSIHTRNLYKRSHDQPNYSDYDNIIFLAYKVQVDWFNTSEHNDKVVSLLFQNEYSKDSTFDRGHGTRDCVQVGQSGCPEVENQVRFWNISISRVIFAIVHLAHDFYAFQTISILLMDALGLRTCRPAYAKIWYSHRITLSDYTGAYRAQFTRRRWGSCTIPYRHGHFGTLLPNNHLILCFWIW